MLVLNILQKFKSKKQQTEFSLHHSYLDSAYTRFSILISGEKFM
jgi:hypothetical protein